MLVEMNVARTPSRSLYFGSRCTGLSR